MTRNKFAAVSLGAVTVALGAGVASADTIVGNPSQSNQQAHVFSQGGIQSTGGGASVGTTSQVAGNSAANGSANTQEIGLTIVPNNTTLVGNAAESSTQGVSGTQSLVQSSNASTSVGPVAQVGTNANTTAQTNSQGSPLDNFGIDSNVIVGAPTQSAAQYSGVSQGVGQSASGNLVGGLGQLAANADSPAQVSTQEIGVDATSVIVGTPFQNTGQFTVHPQSITQTASNPVVVGGIAQGQTNSFTGSKSAGEVIL